MPYASDGKGRHTTTTATSLSARLFFSVFTICALTTRDANALTFLGYTVPIAPVSGISARTVEQEFLAGTGDFGVTTVFQVLDPDTLMIAETVSVNPFSPQNVLNAYFSGYIPKDGQTINSKVFPVRDTDRFRRLNTSIPAAPFLPPDQQPTGRRLLEFIVDVGDKTEQWAIYPDTVFVEAMCINALAHNQNPAQWRVCSPGATTEQYNTYNAAVVAEADGLKRYADTLRQVNATEQAVQQALQNTDVVLANWQNITGARLSYFHDYIETSINKSLAVFKVLTNSLDAESSTLASLTNHTGETAGAFSQVVKQQNTTMNRARAAMAADFTSFSATLQSYLDTLSNDFTKDAGILRAQQRTDLDLLGLLLRINTNVDMKRYQNEQIQAAFTLYAGVPNSRGNTLDPFVFDYGSHPAVDVNALGTVFNHITHTDIVSRKVLPDNTGVATRQRYQCNTLFSVRSASQYPSAEDTLSWIGPGGCDPSWTGSGRTCICVLVFEESKCPLRSTAGVVSPLTLEEWFNGTVAVDTTTGCLTDGVPWTPGVGGLDGTAGTTIGEIGARMATDAQRGILAGTAIKFVSLIRNAVATVAYSDSMRNSSVDNFLSLSMPRNIEIGNNSIFWMTQEWANSFIFTKARLQAYERVVDGDLPNGIEQHELLYERLPSGDLLTRGTMFSVFLASRETLVVSKLVPSTIIQKVQYTINGVTTTSGDVTVDDPNQVYITHQRLMAWNPEASDSVMYDAPQSEISVHPIAGKRWHKISYVIATDPTRLARDAFEADNGESFEDSRASNVAAVYETATDNDPNSLTYTQCIGSSAAGFSEGCALRSHYSFAAFGTFTVPGVAGSIIYTARAATMKFKIPVFLGPIAEEVGVGCPLPGVLRSFGSTYVVPLTNRGTSTIVVGVSQQGACARTFNPPTISIRAGATVAFSQAVVCLTAPPSNPDRLVFTYQLKGATIQCTTPAPLIASVPTNSDMDTVPIANYTINLVTYSADPIMSDLLALETQLRNNTIAILKLSTASLAALPFRLTNLTYDGTDAVNAAIAQASSDSQNDTSTIVAIVTNATSVTSAYDQELAALAQAQTQKKAESDSALQQLNQTYAAVQLSLPKFIVIADVLNETAPAVVESGRLLGNAFLAVIGAGFLTKDEPWELTGYAQTRSAWYQSAQGVFGMGVLGGLTGVDYVVKTVDSAENGVTGAFANLLGSGSLGPLIAMVIIVAILFFVGPPVLRACCSACGSAREQGSKVSTTGDPRVLDLYRFVQENRSA